jgi:hypothetical protein
MEPKRSMTRAELELAVRAELADMAATTWRAKVAADYILAIIDDYAQAERERMEKRLRELMGSST